MSVMHQPLRLHEFQSSPLGDIVNPPLGWSSFLFLAVLCFPPTFNFLRLLFNDFKMRIGDIPTDRLTDRQAALQSIRGRLMGMEVLRQNVA